MGEISSYSTDIRFSVKYLPITFPSAEIISVARLWSGWLMLCKVGDFPNNHRKLMSTRNKKSRNIQQKVSAILPSFRYQGKCLNLSYLYLRQLMNFCQPDFMNGKIEESRFLNFSHICFFGIKMQSYCKRWNLLVFSVVQSIFFTFFFGIRHELFLPKILYLDFETDLYR
ncbi:hypothetical protein SDC9_184745 [bioreactor metagenome]|uniref:Uncharacterized protein n=1 Tax=bioreactor metagenome TaxID=1076179 RepID=A0A645HGD0_9ZZZZ